ncbi:MAG TPA: hypothetical protein VNM40_01260 [Candidatus Paceibacterota bacterium]|nr:hypothetical protein [Candidatus Paceibacterota bacterium]
MIILTALLIGYVALYHVFDPILLRTYHYFILAIIVVVAALLARYSEPPKGE